VRLPSLKLPSKVGRVKTLQRFMLRLALGKNSKAFIQKQKMEMAFA
jgi:hypothetical protein